MIRLITKKINCADVIECGDNIREKLKVKFPDLKLSEKPHAGHVSIYHEKNNHLIWLSFYEKKGENVSSKSIQEVKKNNVNYLATYQIYKNDKIITMGIKEIKEIKEDSEFALKYSTAIPSIKEIEKALA